MSRYSNRRQFLAYSTASATAAVACGSVHSQAEAKQEPVRMGVIGCGGIMTHHVRGLAPRNDVSLAWLCDVDLAQIAKVTRHLDGLTGQRPRATKRFEQVLEDKSVDAVVIATPHHWHAPIALAAMQAGKDCYIEKPISHVYQEGNLTIQAARRYGRVVQQGSQMRSSPVTLQAEKLLKAGIIGEVKVARAWTAEVRRAVPPAPDQQPPKTVDYDRWLGPAPNRPFNPNRFHRTWRMFRDYGNGEIGDDGIHDLDMAAWGLSVDTLPRQITARGGRTLKGHASEYPDNMHVVYEYPDGRLLIYENYPFTSYGLHGFDNGNVFYGTEGYMIFSRRGAFRVFLGPKEKPGPTEEKQTRGQRGYTEHMDDFLHAIRTRQQPRADALTAHRSCALVHLGEIAYRTEGRLDFDPSTEKFVGCEEANRMLVKQYREPYGLPENL